MVARLHFEFLHLFTPAVRLSIVSGLWLSLLALVGAEFAHSFLFLQKQALCRLLRIISFENNTKILFIFFKLRHLQAFSPLSRLRMIVRFLTLLMLILEQLIPIIANWYKFMLNFMSLPTGGEKRPFPFLCFYEGFLIKEEMASSGLILQKNLKTKHELSGWG